MISYSEDVAARHLFLQYIYKVTLSDQTGFETRPGTFLPWGGAESNVPQSKKYR